MNKEKKLFLEFRKPGEGKIRFLRHPYAVYFTMKKNTGTPLENWKFALKRNLGKLESDCVICDVNKKHA